jgi:hypothetical protein
LITYNIIEAASSCGLPNFPMQSFLIKGTPVLRFIDKVAGVCPDTPAEYSPTRQIPARQPPEPIKHLQP